jgi:hypothetical protein
VQRFGAAGEGGFASALLDGVPMMDRSQNFGFLGQCSGKEGICRSIFFAPVNTVSRDAPTRLAAVQ